ncbi:MAG: hypothetical protein ACFCU6_06320 [Balneolaceae bacterium]
MIELHRPEIDPLSDELEERLNDMIIKYKTERYKNEETTSIDLPCIKEGSTLVTGSEKIKKYLLELEQELKWQRSLSGDGCYIDPDTGETC